MKNKKIFAALAALVMLFTLCVPGVFAAGEGVDVLVSISDGNPENGLEMAWEKVTVTDTDGDGALTISDALYAAHESGFKGGASAGFASSVTEYGISLNKLWGVDNGGAYGYCVNDASALSLSDAVAAGDRVYAYAYSDLTGWSDSYAYFDLSSVEVASGDTVALTLTVSGYDAEWNPVSSPFEGAKILVDGEDTGVVTDTEGKAEVTLSGKGVQIISAAADSAVLVPPVCVAQVAGGISVSTICLIAGAFCCAAAVVLGLISRKKKNA